MAKKQVKLNIEEIDSQIAKLTEELKTIEYSDDDYELKLQKIEDLSKVRNLLVDGKVKDSHAGAIISGAFGISAILLVLHYEKANAVTSKAFGLATGLFRGR